MLKKFFFVSVVILQVFSCFGQSAEKEIHSRGQLWLGAFNQTRFSNRWGMWVDVHYRMTDHFVDRSFQFLIRPAVTYFITDNLRVNIGYAFASHFPGKGLRTTRYEHRPWQQIWWSQQYVRLNMRQWIRFEQRFNEKIVSDVKEDGYNHNFRVRYSVSFTIPLKGKELAAKNYFFATGNEIFLNFGESVVYNTFDQNRLSIGFGYQFTSHLNAQLSYMNVYQQEPSGNNYILTHAIRLYVLHSLDLRTKD